MHGYKAHSRQQYVTKYVLVGVAATVVFTAASSPPSVTCLPCPFKDYICFVPCTNVAYDVVCTLLTLGVQAPCALCSGYMSPHPAENKQPTLLIEVHGVCCFGIEQCFTVKCSLGEKTLRPMSIYEKSRATRVLPVTTAHRLSTFRSWCCVCTYTFRDIPPNT